jgi:hypothetical protein
MYMKFDIYYTREENQVRDSGTVATKGSPKRMFVGRTSCNFRTRRKGLTHQACRKLISNEDYA